MSSSCSSSLLSDDLDLDLDHYQLNDILALFNLKYNFTESDLKNAKKIITVSDFTKKEIIELYKSENSKINVVYNGYNRGLYKKIEDEAVIPKIKNNYRKDD